jgi:Cytochrome P450
MELFLFTSALLQKFTFTLPTDEPTPSLEPYGDIVMTPKPFKVILQLRQ